MTAGKSLLIFAKYPRPGEVKTRLGAALGMQRAALIYATFAEHAFAIGEELAAWGSRVSVLYDPSASRDEVDRWVGGRFTLLPQEGATLGNRMRAGFDRAFHDGAERVVVIGTDVPELEAARVRRAFDMLSTHQAVIGPTVDGGYYLLGMKKPGLDVFTGVPWGTGSVLEKTLGLLRDLSATFAMLPELADIDTEEDYLAYVERWERS